MSLFKNYVPRTPRIGESDVSYLLNRNNELLVSDPVRLYRVTLKSGARGVIEAQGAVKAWQSITRDAKLIARVEIMLESVWHELKGVV